ncbi:MAG: hypothetical protein II124_03695, partial [Clostridia bacterium]|nr:hypothetical protein [Clostridia bacterium]
PAQTPEAAPSGGPTSEAQTPAPTEVSFTGPVQTETAPTGPVQSETASTGPAQTEKPDGPDGNGQTGAAKKVLPYAGGAAALALAAVLAVGLIKRKKRDEN